MLTKAHSEYLEILCRCSMFVHYTIVRAGFKMSSTVAKKSQKDEWIFFGTFVVENVPLITLFWPAMLVKGPLVE